MRLWVVLASALLSPTASACAVPLSALHLDFPDSSCQDPQDRPHFDLDDCRAVPEAQDDSVRLVLPAEQEPTSASRAP